MPYKESDLCSEFKTYLRKNPKAEILQFPFVIEYKLKHNNETLHLTKDFQPQQIPSLLKATNSCLYHKISDGTMGMKPFDAFQVCHTPAFVGIGWYRPRVKKILYLINVKSIQRRIEQNLLRYSEEDAKSEAKYIINL